MTCPYGYPRCEDAGQCCATADDYACKLDDIAAARNDKVDGFALLIQLLNADPTVVHPSDIDWQAYCDAFVDAECARVFGPAASPSPGVVYEAQDEWDEDDWAGGDERALTAEELGDFLANHPPTFDPVDPVFVKDMSVRRGRGYHLGDINPDDADLDTPMVESPRDFYNPGPHKRRYGSDRNTPAFPETYAEFEKIQKKRQQYGSPGPRGFAEQVEQSAVWGTPASALIVNRDLGDEHVEPPKTLTRDEKEALRGKQPTSYQHEDDAWKASLYVIPHYYPPPIRIRRVIGEHTVETVIEPVSRPFGAWTRPGTASTGE